MHAVSPGASAQILCVQQVTRQLAAGVAMPVRVTGPMGRTTDRALDHPVLLIFAGGVGVSHGTTVTLVSCLGKVHDAFDGLPRSCHISVF